MEGDAAMISAAPANGPLVRLICPATGGSTIIERWRAEAAVAAVETPGHFLIENFRACQCCGKPAYIWYGSDNLIARCRQHHNSNPCAIEGCKHTRKIAERGRLANDAWICSDHWRWLVRPGSRDRRAYNAFWRRAKRQGMDDRRARQFWKMWDLIVARARRRSAGDLDMREVCHLFGWDDDAPG